MNSKDLGNLAELSVAKALIARGISVSFPFGDNERYDLILDDESQLRKAQVRKATERNGYLIFKCYSNHKSHGEIKRESFDSSEIDCFLVWHEREDNVYNVPIEAAPKSEMRLRLDETENNQSKNINWASNYLLD